MVILPGQRRKAAAWLCSCLAVPCNSFKVVAIPKAAVLVGTEAARSLSFPIRHKTDVTKEESKRIREQLPHGPNPPPLPRPRFYFSEEEEGFITFYAYVLPYQGRAAQWFSLYVKVSLPLGFACIFVYFRAIVRSSSESFIMHTAPRHLYGCQIIILGLPCILYDVCDFFCNPAATVRRQEIRRMTKTRSSEVNKA